MHTHTHPTRRRTTIPPPLLLHPSPSPFSHPPLPLPPTPYTSNGTDVTPAERLLHACCTPAARHQSRHRPDLTHDFQSCPCRCFCPMLAVVGQQGCVDKTDVCCAFLCQWRVTLNTNPPPESALEPPPPLCSAATRMRGTALARRYLSTHFLDVVACSVLPFLDRSNTNHLTTAPLLMAPCICRPYTMCCWTPKLRDGTLAE